MNENILLVDDEPYILDGYRRSLRKLFQVDTALGGAEGLKIIDERGPYAVTVSDLRMPEMDGIEFLSKVRTAAPDTVRMMLTGHADLDASIDAVNEGNIFRFLTKPCPPEFLTKALRAGIQQFHLVTAERELLENTLSGSVKLLTDILSITSPSAFGRATRIRRIMLQLADKLGIERKWEFELAGMLSQTGCVTLPIEIIEKINNGDNLTEAERDMFENHPIVGHDLVGNIPRLEILAEIILYQEKHYNGQGIPQNGVSGDNIPLGARALHLALDYDRLTSTGRSSDEAIWEIKSKSDQYDPEFVDALDEIVLSESKRVSKKFKIKELVNDMIVAQDIKTSKGTVIVSKGQSVTGPVKERLRNFESTGELNDSVEIFVPMDDSGYVG